jgi:hypothetical protein
LNTFLYLITYEKKVNSTNDRYGFFFTQKKYKKDGTSAIAAKAD